MSMGGGFPSQAGSSSLPRAPQPPSVTQSRSKRPKLQTQTSRVSLGGGETPGLQTGMRPCAKLLRDMMNHPLASPFLKPVDPNLVPDYYTIVSDPMDLGTIKKRLENGDFEDTEEFADAVRQVWTNCFLYNVEGTPIRQNATTLQQLFETKFKDVPSVADSENNQAMKAMEKKIKAMQKQMQEQTALLAAQQTLALQSVTAAANAAAVPPPPPSAPKRPAKKKSGGGSRQSGAGGGFGGPAYPLQQSQPEQVSGLVAVDESRDMTFEQKTALSGNINKLTSNNLGKVVQIIRSNMPSLGAGSDEIEVDINALDNVTLWKLHNFVTSCNASRKKPTKKAPTMTAANRLQAVQQAQAHTEQRLSQLRAGLDHLDGGGISFGDGGDGDRDAGDSPSDSDSDGGAMPALTAKPSGGANGGGSALFADFQNTKLQRQREEEDSDRRRNEQQQQEAESQRQRQKQQAHALHSQRAAERARREEEGGIDMMGQSNAMASFEKVVGDEGFDEFELDEYGT